MSDIRIYDKETQTQVRVKKAIELGLKENPGRFNIPGGKVIIKQGARYTLMTTTEATTAFKAGKFQLCDILGTYNFDMYSGYVKKAAPVGKRIVKNLTRAESIGNIKRYVLNNQDKRSYYALYNFIRTNKITGRGNFIVARNGRVIFEDVINIDGNLSKWWKNTGHRVGLVDSSSHVWTELDISVKKRGNVKTAERVQVQQIIKIDGDNEYTLKPQFKKQNFKTDLNNTVVIFYFSKDDTINPNKIYQTFRDNTTNTCFFDCIESRLIDTDDKHKQSLLNKVIKYKQQYPAGLPMDDIQKVVDDLKIAVKINDIFNNNYLQYRPTQGRIRDTVKYINSRCDHLELNTLCDDNNNIVEVIDRKKLKEIIINKFEQEKPCYYMGTINEPNTVHTEEGTYKYINKENEIINAFNESIKLYDFAIDYNKNKDLCEWLRDGINYNSHCNFYKYESNDIELEQEYQRIEQDAEYHEYDMKKAYTQYKNCDYYIGFPNIMTPIVNCTNMTIKDIKKYVGYYKVKIVSVSNENVKNILDTMGLSVGNNYIFTSPELLFFHASGVKFDIISGSYSLTPYHFDLAGNMYEDTTIDGKIVKNRLYCKWGGKLNALNEFNTVKTRCNKKLAEDLATRYENIKINNFNSHDIDNDDNEDRTSEYFNEDNVDCIVSTKKKEVNYLGHIGGYITAYTRINVLKHLFKINHANIVGFKLDGFIIKGEHNFKEDYKLWAEKPKKVNFNWAKSIFDNIELSETETQLSNELWLKRINFLSGAGGCGKSYSVLKHCNAMYIVAPWRLGVEQSRIYGIKCLTYNQFLGVNCESYLDRNKPPPYIFIDEITQIDEKYIKSIIKKCPYSIIFIAGDIDKDGDYYQCSFKDVNVISKFDKKWGFTEYIHNYRCKDNILLQKLNDLRTYMKETKFNNKLIVAYVIENFKDRITTEEYLTSTYNYKQDWVLCSTTESDDSQTKYYTNLLTGNKYLCIKHTADDVYKKLDGVQRDLKGEILYDIEEPTGKYELRHAFTIHSFQGITVKNPSRLFIDTKHIFCPRQLYTALSRVERLEQIYLL